MSARVLERRGGNHPRAKCMFVSACTYLHNYMCGCMQRMYVHNYIHPYIYISSYIVVRQFVASLTADSSHVPVLAIVQATMTVNDGAGGENTIFRQKEQLCGK